MMPSRREIEETLADLQKTDPDAAAGLLDGDPGGYAFSLLGSPILGRLIDGQIVAFDNILAGKGPRTWRMQRAVSGLIALGIALGSRAAELRDAERSRAVG